MASDRPPLWLCSPPFYSKNSLKTQKSSSTPLLLVLLLTIFLHIPRAVSLTATESPEYAKHCNDVLPESPIDSTVVVPSTVADSLGFAIGFFTGGDSIFNQSDTTPKSAAFYTLSADRTIANDATNVYSIRGRLLLQIQRSLPVVQDNGYMTNPRGLRQLRIRWPRIPVHGRELASFILNGYWLESSGRLCMVGSGSGNGLSGKLKSFNVVLKLNYSKSSSIFGSIVTGVLESLDDRYSFNHFSSVAILGVRRNTENHEYTLVESGNGDSWLNGDDIEGEGLSVSQVVGGICTLTKYRAITFELENGNDCNSASCSPIHGMVGYAPSFMLFSQIMCTDKGKMQILLTFRNSSSIGSTTFLFDPNTSLIAEGEWDEKKKRLRGVACQFLNFSGSLTDASVGDCSTKFSLRFPKILSLKKMGSPVGHIWKIKTERNSGNFGPIAFSSVRQLGLRRLDFKYEYTEIDSARKSCANKNGAKRKGNTYPNADSSDLAFSMTVKNNKGQTFWGYATPLFVGYEQYQYHPDIPLPGKRDATVQLSNKESSPLNISYRITLRSNFSFASEIPISSEVELFAEGLYDRYTGLLCMKGCRPLGSHREKFKNNSLDCDIVVSVQFSPLNGAGSAIKGTIESTRTESDPLYFGRIDLSSRSIYTNQARESILRMDLEIAMVLISNTLTCFFLGLQLFHVKKHPDVLPFISVVMLIVLTVGLMIPLLLNFEALFVNNHNQPNAFLESGGWLEVNEIIVRMVTMVAFLLQFRLLQLAWCSRHDDESQKYLWNSDKKVLYVSLPFYICGGLIAWFLHRWKNSHQSPFLQIHNKRRVVSRPPVHRQSSLWIALKSYGGLVLDCFLLPQIAFNIFSDSSKRSLAASFYVGTTLVRLLPHAYDLYRAHSTSEYFDWSYIYANHKLDFYSTAWDIIIPCCGLVFAVFIFAQQKFGGRCLLPKRIGENSLYEKVPVVNSEELQGESVQKNFYTL